MSVFDGVVIICALCGAAMIVGGIFLLYRGSITLAATPKTTAMSIEWRKQFRISTQVPGIAFFLVGLFFMVVALWVSKPTLITPLDLVGHIDTIDAPVTILVRSTPWSVPTSTSGEIRGRIYPDMTVLVLEVIAPGYQSHIDVKSVNKSVVEIGKITLTKSINTIESRPGNIDDIPFTTPPLNSKPAFGVSQ